MLPRLIHRIWLGGPEPDYTARFAASWESPRWQLVTWGETDVAHLVRETGPLVNQDLYDRAEEIAPDHVGQLRSDVLRYEILYRAGGIYVDADLAQLRPIDSLVEGLDCFAAWEVQDRWIANGFMGATQQHPFIGKLIFGLKRNVERENGQKPNRMSGPRYVTAMWQRHGRHDGVEILPQRLVYPYGWQELEREHEGFPDAFTSHWWHNKRRERGLLPA